MRDSVWCIDWRSLMMGYVATFPLWTLGVGLTGVILTGVVLAGEPGTLHVTPETIRFEAPESSEQLLVTLFSADGKPSDKTREAQYSVSSEGVVHVDAQGRVVPIAQGRTQLIARLGNTATTVDVEVGDLGRARSISYQQDVIPILSKASCNSGGCHGKAEGQNGFKLSVFGFDTIADHHALTAEGRGRRVMPSAPKRSLLLRKATAELPHGGGQKIEVDSRWYRQLRRWIAEGAQWDVESQHMIREMRVEPSVITLPAHGRQQLKVTAKDAHGNWRCVTAEAEYESNHDVVAEVNRDGWIMASDVPGEAAILVRYLGQVSVCRVTRPQRNVMTTRLPERNFIDRFVGDKLLELAIRPSEPATDAEFLRRVHLDTIGTLPSPREARHFLLDTTSDKRKRLVDALLQRAEYADYWSQRWSDLLQLDVDTVTPPAAVAMVRWLREQFVANTPYDKFVRSIVTAKGSTHASSPAAFYQVQGDPEKLARSVSQLFLGVRIECAQCHHHPFERWDQHDYLALAGFFTGIDRKATPLGGLKIVAQGGSSLPHPRTGEFVHPAALGEPPTDLRHVTDRRDVLADWMTSRKNYWFPRVIVNRLWSHYMGRGLVEPLDDLRATNPASNEPLMDALVDHLLELNYDLKAFTRTLLDSHVYQLSSRPNDSNRLDAQSHSHAAWKPLPAEVLLDAISQATEVPEAFTGWPAGRRAIQIWDNRLPSRFLDVFGRPSRQTVCACERGTEPSIAQALHLMNSTTTMNKIHDPQGSAARLAASDLAWEDVVEECYLATLSRFPSEAEQRLMRQVLGEAKNRREAAEDVLWTLLNTKSFLFNP